MYHISLAVLFIADITPRRLGSDVSGMLELGCINCLDSGIGTPFSETRSEKEEGMEQVVGWTGFSSLDVSITGTIVLFMKESLEILSVVWR